MRDGFAVYAAIAEKSFAWLSEHNQAKSMNAQWGKAFKYNPLFYFP